MSIATPRAGLQNVRDLGGLPTTDGRSVRHGVLYRSDAPHAGDAAPALAAWPPRHVVDLRNGGESSAAAHPLEGPATTVHLVPMLAAASPRDLAAAQTARLADVYAELLAVAGPLAVRVAGLVAAGDGPVLVHCTAGKDRTGVVVATLLAAAGVQREAIVADYCATEHRMQGVIDRMAHTMSPRDRDGIAVLLAAESEFMRAPAHAIDAVLAALDAAPGGPAGRLRDAGLPALQLERLRERLLD